MGFFDSSSSSATSNTSTSTTTTSTDKRQVADGGAVSISGDTGGPLNVTNTNYTLDANLAGETSRDSAVVAMNAVNDGTTVALSGINLAGQTVATNSTDYGALLDATLKIANGAKQLAEDNYSAGASMVQSGNQSLKDLSTMNLGAFTQLLNAGNDMFKSNDATFQKELGLAATLSSSAQSAYGDATAQANGTKTIVLAGLAVVGIVAAVFLSKRN
jgi:hypothetical protein